MTDAVHRLARELVDICAYHHKNNNLSVADLELAIATTSHALAVARETIKTAPRQERTELWAEAARH